MQATCLVFCGLLLLSFGGTEAQVLSYFLQQLSELIRAGQVPENNALSTDPVSNTVDGDATQQVPGLNSNIDNLAKVRNGLEQQQQQQEWEKAVTPKKTGFKVERHRKLFGEKITHSEQPVKPVLQGQQVSETTVASSTSSSTSSSSSTSTTTTTFTSTTTTLPTTSSSNRNVSAINNHTRFINGELELSAEKTSREVDLKAAIAQQLAVRKWLASRTRGKLDQQPIRIENAINVNTTTVLSGAPPTDATNTTTAHVPKHHLEELNARAVHIREMLEKKQQA